jgi:anti-sigma regulatory factor (Ser/Thr protein kinase)
MPHSESFVISNRRAEVSAFADRFEGFCEQHGIATVVVRAFQVALDEVLANIVDYAHPDGGAHPIEVRLTLADGRMDAEVIDDGLAYDPLENSKPPDLEADLASRPMGGLGVHLIRNLMDDVAYRRVGAHNHLLMSKRLPSS